MQTLKSAIVSPTYVVSSIPVLSKASDVSRLKRKIAILEKEEKKYWKTIDIEKTDTCTYNKEAAEKISKRFGPYYKTFFHVCRDGVVIQRVSVEKKQKGLVVHFWDCSTMNFINPINIPLNDSAIITLPKF